MRIELTIVIVLVCGLAACSLPAASDDAAPAIAQTETLFAPGVEETMAAVPMVSVSIATDCRAGPGQVYDPVGVLNPGQVSEAAGLSPEGDYWLIRDPASPTTLCWLGAEDVTVTGDPGGLPVSVPPPTPTLVVTQVGCPTPVGGGSTPVSCPELAGCPTPIGGGPTPVSCSSPVGACPTPIGGGPTPVSCISLVGGCPTPVGGGPTPVSCVTPVGGPSLMGYPTPWQSPESRSRSTRGFTSPFIKRVHAHCGCGFPRAVAHADASRVGQINGMKTSIGQQMKPSLHVSG